VAARQVSDQTRARLAEANSRNHRRRRAAIADRLQSLGELTNKEAAAVVGASATTVRGIRDEYGLPRPAAELRLAGEQNRRRSALRHAELASRLETLGALRAAEAAQVLGVSRSTVKRIRAERRDLPSPRRPRTGWEEGP
jgi:DNA-directed RNA polymerase specialized sigma24 family protein